MVGVQTKLRFIKQDWNFELFRKEYSNSIRSIDQRSLFYFCATNY
jgi:hypothetical protein